MTELEPVAAPPPLAGLSDEELVRRVTGGEPALFEVSNARAS
jgi:hypothetical protein